jgi:hypothetical protein
MNEKRSKICGLKKSQTAAVYENGQARLLTHVCEI